MKKALLFFAALMIICSVSNANASENCEKISTSVGCGCERGCDKKIKKNECKNTLDKKKCCQKCENSCVKEELEDDEYYTYNQCFFDKKYRKLKKMLCLTQRQETCLDNYYKNFKTDMENNAQKYRNCKNSLLETIECDRGCLKEQKRSLKAIKKDSKEKCKDFRDEVNELLCKNQRKTFRKFQRYEKRKMRKIVKYAAVYKFPCVNCCSK